MLQRNIEYWKYCESGTKQINSADWRKQRLPKSCERVGAEKHAIMKVKKASTLISCKLSASAINNILGGVLTGVTTSGAGNATNPSCGCTCRYSADQKEWDTDSPDDITSTYLWGTTLASDNAIYPNAPIAPSVR